jgi:hypothetical protein
MDNELFVKKLKELAQLKQVKTPGGPAIRMPDDPEPVWRNGKEFIVSKDNNPTLTYEIVRMYPIVKDCEDCGKESVSDRSVQRKLSSFPQNHWRVSCSHCKMNQHPETGEFSIPNNIVNVFFHRYYSIRNK